MGLDVITGGAGFIGSHLVDTILGSTDRAVRVIDNFATGSRKNLAHQEANPRLEVIEADLADRGRTQGLFEGAERVFHLAALADIVPSIEHPDAYFRANVDGTFHAVREAVRAGVKRFVYAASSTCYGFPETYPTPEGAPISPQYPYALTKYLGEVIAIHWAQVYKLPAVSLRMFNVYGPRARTSGTYGAVFGVFLAQMLADEPVTIVGDGNQTRDFTFVSDVAAAFLTAAASNRVGEIYNVGSGGTYSINHLVELLGARNKIHIPKRPGEPDCTFADIRNIKRDLGWCAKVSFQDGVKIMLDSIEYWRDAPVWTPNKISEATEGWFKYLGSQSA